MRLDRLLTLGLVNPMYRIVANFTPRSPPLCLDLATDDAPEPRTNTGLAAASNGVLRLPILMYHSISDNPENGINPYYKTCTSPKRFAEHMAWLAAAGYRGVTLSEGLAVLQAKSAEGQGMRGKGQRTGALTSTPSPSPLHSSPIAPLPLPPSPIATSPAAKPVAITFDDGFRDFYTEAVPCLSQHGFFATMYLPTAYIGDNRKTFKTHECLTWGEVRELAATGIEFGSHTVTHPRLATLSWENIETELRDSKAAIEQQLGHPVPTFAYPFAFPQEDKPFAQRFHATLDAIGYHNCVTTTIGRAHTRSDALHLPRLPVNSADDRDLLLAKLNGAYDWLAIPQKMGKFARRFMGVAPRGSQSTPPTGSTTPWH